MEQNSNVEEELLISLTEHLKNANLGDLQSEDPNENTCNTIEKSGANSELENMTLNSVMETVENENAMNNVLVVECIFKFLPVDDLKTCRSVNWNWYLIAEPILREKVQVTFDERRFLLPEMFIDCSNDFLTEAPFDSFIFDGELTDFQHMKYFFEKYGMNVKDLTLRTIKSANYAEISNNLGHQSFFGSFNITPWVDPSNLRKLHLRNFNSDNKLEFSLAGLHSLEDFSAMHYNIDIKGMESNRIAPVSLYMWNLHFYRGKSFVNEISLNDIFDFRRAKYINVIGRTRDLSATKLSLDMSLENVNADRVVLGYMDLKNFEVCKWIVNKLNWSNMHFSKTQMQIKNLYFELSLESGHSLDLCCLPEAIETLDFNCCDSPIFCSRPIKLNKVKYLCYGADYEMYNDISTLLDTCANLEEMYLYGPGTFNIDQVPSTLSVMKLRDHVMPDWGDDVNENKKLCLQKLILKEFTMDEIEEVASKITSQVLVVTLDSDPDPSDEILNFVLENNTTDRFKKIVCGLRNNRDHLVKLDISLEFVDEKAGFYSFENQYGSKITYDQFKEFKHLSRQ